MFDAETMYAQQFLNSENNDFQYGRPNLFLLLFYMSIKSKMIVYIEYFLTV